MYCLYKILDQNRKLYYYLNVWGYSSAGRTLEWHSRGQGFDSPYLHHTEAFENIVFEAFSFYPKLGKVEEKLNKS